jgi:saccharopine dehydrogenase (NAD+, L-lysine-forming)
MLASRNEIKCRHIVENVRSKTGKTISTAQLDADQTIETIRIIDSFKPNIVINVALPYQDLSIMDACLETGVDYLDTANYEPPNKARFEYKWQWAYHDRFRKKGIMALLGSGFDPGVTNVFCAYALKHRFDEIHELDIIDCNAGDHGHPFATNFNPEINIREVTAKGKYWHDDNWVETEPLAKSMIFDFPEGIGLKKCYLMYHEELESLVKNLKGLKKARFWMTFSDNYLKHLEVLQNVGMTRIDPVIYNGVEIIPLKFLKALLPDPASLGAVTKGKTCIGCLIKGVKDGVAKQYFTYNICDHEEAFKEVGAQAISYTTGVPAMIGAMMILTGKWQGKGVFNMEQFDPDAFMEELNIRGLPWTEIIWKD